VVIKERNGVPAVIQTAGRMGASTGTSAGPASSACKIDDGTVVPPPRRRRGGGLESTPSFTTAKAGRSPSPSLPPRFPSSSGLLQLSSSLDRSRCSTPTPSPRAAHAVPQTACNCTRGARGRACEGSSAFSSDRHPHSVGLACTPRCPGKDQRRGSPSAAAVVAVAECQS
jgi:hypothetical protein